MFVGLRNARKKGFSDLISVLGVFHKIHVVDGASRMKLRHVERIHVPKFGFHQGAINTIESGLADLFYEARALQYRPER